MRLLEGTLLIGLLINSSLLAQEAVPSAPTIDESSISSSSSSSSETDTASTAPPPPPPPPPPAPVVATAPPAPVVTTAPAAPTSNPGPSEYRNVVLGGYLGIGMGTIRNSYLQEQNTDLTPLLVGMNEFHFMYFFSRIVGIDIGAGLMGKGLKEEESDGDNDSSWEYRETRLELPVGVAFNFGAFRLGANLVPSYVLIAKSVWEYDGITEEEKMTSDDWENSDYRRFNICSRLTLGGRIAFNSRAALLLGVLTEYDILNNYKGDGDETDRNFNVMAIAGFEFGL